MPISTPGGYWPDDCIPDPKLRHRKPGRKPRKRAAPQKGPAPERHRQPAEPVNPEFFDWLKIAAVKNWRHCKRAECAQRRKCCGGPRGVAKRRGIPVCWPGRTGEDWAAREVAGLLEVRAKWAAHREGPAGAPA